MSQREIVRILPAMPTRDGDGVKIRRVNAHSNISLLDPFLMLDEIASDEAADYIGGFPPHPHRGFETITYMLDGQMRHTDHMGNEGLLKAGGVQWMTAGRGVIHAEMPEQTEGRLHGFQILINLPARDKMQPARYQEFDPSSIPEIALNNGGTVRVITGEFAGHKGPVDNIVTDPLYFDINLPAGADITLPVKPGHSVLVYPFTGAITIAGKPVTQGQLAQLSDGESISIQASSASRLLLLAGKPIREPIAHYGPFVMNTQEEIEQAISDYRNGTLTD